jgi:hypothetical protein
MDEAAPVKLSKRRRDSNGKRQEALQRHRPSDQPLERLAARVLTEQGKPHLVKLQPQGPGRPGRIELLSQRIGVLQPPEGFG